jgi:hypothetical protein
MTSVRAALLAVRVRHKSLTPRERDLARLGISLRAGVRIRLKGGDHDQAYIDPDACRHFHAARHRRVRTAWCNGGRGGYVLSRSQ